MAGECSLWLRYPRGTSCYYEREIEGKVLAYCNLCEVLEGAPKQEKEEPDATQALPLLRSRYQSRF